MILDRSCESFSSPRFSRKTIRPSTCHVRVNNGLAFPAGRIIFVTEFGSSVCVGALVCGHCRLIGYFGCRRQRHRTGQVGCSADEMGVPTDVQTDVFAVNISRVDASRSECWKFKFLEIFKIKIIYIQTTWILLIIIIIIVFAFSESLFILQICCDRVLVGLDLKINNTKTITTKFHWWDNVVFFKFIAVTFHKKKKSLLFKILLVTFHVVDASSLCLNEMLFSSVSIAMQ